MLTAIRLFLKDKVFSGTGLIVTLFTLILAVFLFSNSNVILSKLGFETTTTLKANLVKTEGALHSAVTINDGLVKTVDKVINNSIKKEEVLVESFVEREQVKQTVATVNKTKTNKVKEVVRVLEQETKITDTVITIPAAEYNKASEANIDSLHDAFDKLFTDGVTNHA